MPLEVKYNAELKIVESAFSGIVSVEELKQETEQSITLAHKHQAYRLLCDASEGKFPMSIINAITLEQMNRDMKLPRNAKIAFIASTDRNSHDLGQFYEDLCANSGWLVGSFKDRESALAWLDA